MNNNSNKFFDGLLLGLLLGGSAVFLLGTKTGKNLLKIISDRGIDGISEILEAYQSGEFVDDEYDEYDEEAEFEEEVKQKAEEKPEDRVEEKTEIKESEEKKEKIIVSNNAVNKVDEQKPAPKKRFFKRFNK